MSIATPAHDPLVQKSQRISAIAKELRVCCQTPVKDGHDLDEVTLALIDLVATTVTAETDDRAFVEWLRRIAAHSIEEAVEL